MVSKEERTGRKVSRRVDDYTKNKLKLTILLNSQLQRSIKVPRLLDDEFSQTLRRVQALISLEDVRVHVEDFSRIRVDGSFDKGRFTLHGEEDGKHHISDGLEPGGDGGRVVGWRKNGEGERVEVQKLTTRTQKRGRGKGEKE